MPASLSVVARRLSFVRETEGPNRGAWVEMLQRFCDGVPGDSWCADFVSFIEDVAYHGAAPLPRSGSCQVKLDYARRKGYEVTTPQIDDVYFFVDATGHAHHMGIVSGLDPVLGIAANTSEDGRSSNGTGVFEHAIPLQRTVFVRLPK